MQPERWRQIEEIFQSAADRAPQSRSALLESACGEDTELRRDVESLLALHENSAPTSASSVADAIAVLEQRNAKLNACSRIGAYRILQEIGRGGMGTVYLAARADDAFQKQVAIKVIRRGLDTDDISQRFRSERQILAMLDHPNIARLLDGGTTDEGLPYFVMEYIEGEPIDLYCDQRKLTVTERLKLFQGVCAAVQYAHQNLVVHRDIKPGNVLVTKEGVPRLLDFGIAKLLAPGTEQEDRTAAGLRPLTPDYASPEQVRGGAITTASDVYSLGVLLYLLLTGRRPYRHPISSQKEIQHLSQAEPEKLSVAAMKERTEPKESGNSGTAGSPSVVREGTPEKLRWRVRGDLDNIASMALRKEPQRRYASAEQLADDIRRHLANLPVIARPDTVGYRTTKFVARHKAGVAAAALLVLTLAAGVIATAWQARVARLETAKAQRINIFLQDMLGFANTGWESSNLAKNPDAKVSEVIELAAARAGTELADQPEILAEMRRTIGTVYIGQSRWKQAEEVLRPAFESQMRLYGPNHREVARTSHMLAWALDREGNWVESERLFRNAVSTFRKEAQSGHPDMFELIGTLGGLGVLLDEKGDARAAEPYYREALQYAPKLEGKDRAMVALLDNALATICYKRGDLDDAERLERTAIDEYRKLPAGNYVELATNLSSLGTVLTRKHRFVEAEPYIREALEIDRKLLGNKHFNTAGILGALADLLYSKGDYGAAEDAANEALHIFDQTLPKGNIAFSVPLLQLGLILNKTGRSRIAGTHLRDALAMRTRLLPAGHQNIAVVEGALGECLTTQKRFTEAEPLLLRSYSEMKSNLGEQDPRTSEARLRLVTLYEIWGKTEDATRYRPAPPLSAASRPRSVH
jgi:serine/threonine-protein kinase